MCYSINKMFTIKNLLILVWRNVVASLMVVSIAAIIIFYLEKGINTMTNLIVENQKTEVESKKRNELLSTIEQGVRVMGKNDILINNAFVPSNDISEFTNTLDKLGFDNGTLQTYHFETPIPSSTSEEPALSSVLYSNNFTVVGMKKVSKYLKDFEELPYFTKIESLTLSSQDATGLSGTTNISLKATLITQTIQ